MERIIRYGCIVIALISALIASFFLPRRELRITAQVSGIAIDRNGDNIVATFELFEPGVDQSYGDERSVVASSGKTFEKCIENARLTMGKELYIDDASVLIIGDKEFDYLLKEVLDYYKTYNHDNMSIPLFRAKSQMASKIFDGKGKILSTEIAESARLIDEQVTIKDVYNGVEPDVFIKGAGGYEIVS